MEPTNDVQIQVGVLASADIDLRSLRAFLDGAYGPGFSTEAFGHALGGVHVLVRTDGELVGHAALVTRRLLHNGRPMRAGYVEAVAVRSDRRRSGIGGIVMAEVERLVRGGHELGALASSRMALDFYPGRGWRRWTGPLFASSPSGAVEPTPDNAVFVLPVHDELDTSGELTCDWRDGSPW